MKIYIVVKESSSNNTYTSSSVLGVFAAESSAKQCASKAYEIYILAKSKDYTLH
jgi:hypothetical protein